MSNRYSRLTAIERRFFSSTTSRLKSFDYREAAERVQGFFYTPPANRFYYAEAQPKKRMVLHFTAGNLGGDMNQLTMQDYHVSVPYGLSAGNLPFMKRNLLLLKTRVQNTSQAIGQ